MKITIIIIISLTLTISYYLLYYKCPLLPLAMIFVKVLTRKCSFVFLTCLLTFTLFLTLQRSTNEDLCKTNQFVCKLQTSNLCKTFYLSFCLFVLRQKASTTALSASSNLHIYQPSMKATRRPSIRSVITTLIMVIRA